MSLAIAVTVLAVVLILAGGRLARYRYAKFRRYQGHVQEFYRSIQPLLKDDETPGEVLQVIGFLNSRIDDRHAMYRFLKFVGLGKVFSHTKTERMVPVVHQFFARRPELEESYRDALMHGMMALSFNAPLPVGLIFRFWLASTATTRAEPDLAAENVSEGLIIRMLGGENNHAEARLAA